MPSKNELIVAVIGVAIIGFIVYYFFYSRKSTPQTTSTLPLSAIGSDVGSFVSGVQSAFSKVLSAGGTVMNGIKKDIGWGEKELGNTVGIISSGASRFGRTLVSDTEHFVQGVEHVFGDVGKTLSGGVSIIEGAGAKAEKTVANIPSDLTKLFYPPANIFLKDIKGFETGVSQAPKEIVKDAKTISTSVESGVDSFISGVKSLFSRF